MRRRSGFERSESSVPMYLRKRTRFGGRLSTMLVPLESSRKFVLSLRRFHPRIRSTSTFSRLGEHLVSDLNHGVCQTLSTFSISWFLGGG